MNEPATSRPAVILLSGGLDSATTLAIARRDGFRRFALSVDYGQRQRVELEAARRVAATMGVERHLMVRVDLSAIGGSALTDDIAVPKDRADAELLADIPITYVPARNTVLLACALAWAETLGAFDLFVGVNAIDYSGYPDCRPAFVRSFEALANVATKAGVEGTGRFHVHTPLINMTKAEIIRTGAALGVDYSLTHTCYDPSADGRSCGRCDACRLRRRGFAEAGIRDPIEYAR
jgi:7-cyano-7-deazaguanine synthase